MRVVLINTPLLGVKITRDMAGGLGFNATSKTLLPPLEFAIMAATLKNDGHKVKIIDSEVRGFSDKEVIKQVKEWKPEVVIASISLPSLDNDTKFIKEVKKGYGGRIIAKTSITFEPILKKILKQSEADLCICGEVDLEISKIVDGKSKKGTAFFEGKRLVINPPELIKNLDLLPLPARDLLENNYYRYPLLGNNCTTMQTSRGCPFPCAYYCPYPLVQGREWRPMSPERVYKELSQVVKNYKIRKVLFRDATFTLNRERTKAICQKIIKNKLKLSWWCETRVNCLDKELLEIMKKAGCLGINIGVETGDPEVMRSQGKPGVDLAQLEAIKKIADKLGIKLHFLLLIGLPRETRRSLYSTFNLIKRLRPYSLGVTAVTPYPGTQLYDDAMNNGWIESRDWSRYSGGLSTMHTNNLTSWEIKLVQKMIIAELFFLEKGLLGKIAVSFEDLVFRIWARI